MSVEHADELRQSAARQCCGTASNDLGCTVRVHELEMCLGSGEDTSRRSNTNKDMPRPCTATAISFLIWCLRWSGHCRSFRHGKARAERAVQSVGPCSSSQLARTTLHTGLLANSRLTLQECLLRAAVIRRPAAYSPTFEQAEHAERFGCQPKPANRTDRPNFCGNFYGRGAVAVVEEHLST